MLKGSTRLQNKQNTCKYCGKTFLARDKGKRLCAECENIKCRCGCEKPVRQPWLSLYFGHHGLKGKSYKEIYGTENPKCGFKPGHISRSKIRFKDFSKEKQKLVGKKISDSLRKTQLEKPKGKRIPRRINICTECKTEFSCCDPKRKLCPACLKATKPCACGCGTLIKKYTTIRYFGRHSVAFCRPQNLGKTKSSYGPYGGTCSVKRYPTKSGIMVCSKFERTVADLLFDNHIDFEYDVPIKLHDGSYKIVDFRVGNLYIEVTAIAWKSWQEQFFKKLKLLRESLREELDHILVITPRKKIKLHKESPIFFTHGTNFWLRPLEDPNEILKTIRFCLEMELMNSMLHEQYQFTGKN